MNKKIFNWSKVAAVLTCIALTWTFSTCDWIGNDEDEGDGYDFEEKYEYKQGTSTSKETKAELDNTNFGLYKGVIVGSSGTIRMEINNGDVLTPLRIDFNINNRGEMMFPSSTFTKGEAIVDATFTGYSSSLTFSVDADGKNPVISNFYVEGHDTVMAIVYKEKSKDVVTCFEGTFEGKNKDEGVFNVVRNNNEYSGIIKGSDGFTAIVSGTIKSDNTFIGSTKSLFQPPGTEGVILDVSMTFSGKFTITDVVEGKWQTSWSLEGKSYTNSGTFWGSKTLYSWVN